MIGTSVGWGIMIGMTGLVVDDGDGTGNTRWNDTAADGDDCRLLLLLLLFLILFLFSIQ